MKALIAPAQTNMFKATEKGWCPRCGKITDYGCECPDGKPAFPLVDRIDVKREKYLRIVMAAVDAVYGNYCSNSVTELDAAVVDLLGIPVERDDD